MSFVKTSWHEMNNALGRLLLNILVFSLKSFNGLCVIIGCSVVTRDIQTWNMPMNTRHLTSIKCPWAVVSYTTNPRLIIHSSAGYRCLSYYNRGHLFRSIF